MNKLPDEHYQAMAQKLRPLRPHHNLTVREIAEALGYSSTAAAMNAINNMIRLDLIETEQRGNRKEYYLTGG